MSTIIVVLFTAKVSVNLFKHQEVHVCACMVGYCSDYNHYTTQQGIEMNSKKLLRKQEMWALTTPYHIIGHISVVE